MSHCCTDAHDPRQRFGPPLLRATPALLLESVEPAGPLHEQPDLLGLHRLLVVVVGPELDRAQRTLVLFPAGHDDHLRPRRDREDLLQSGQPLARPVGVGRQSEVEQHHGKARSLHLFEGRLAITRRGDRVSVEGPTQLPERRGVVLDDEQRLAVTHRHLPRSLPQVPRIPLPAEVADAPPCHAPARSRC